MSTEVIKEWWGGHRGHSQKTGFRGGRKRRRAARGGGLRAGKLSMVAGGRESNVVREDRIQEKGDKGDGSG